MFFFVWVGVSWSVMVCSGRVGVCLLISYFVAYFACLECLMDVFWCYFAGFGVMLGYV